MCPLSTSKSINVFNPHKIPHQTEKETEAWRNDCGMPGKCCGWDLNPGLSGLQGQGCQSSQSGRGAWATAPMWEGHHPLGLGTMVAAESKREAPRCGHSHQGRASAT